MSQAKIDKANTLRDSGKTKEAIKILLPLLKSHDYQVATNAHIALGICYANEKKYEKAIELYKKANQISEENGWYSRTGGTSRDIAIAYKNAKKLKEAEKWMLKSLELIKKYYDEGQGIEASLGIGYSKLGQIYSDMKNFPQAKKAFEISKKHLKKGNHEYWKLIGMIDECSFLVASKQFQDAKNIFKIAITEAIKQEKEYKLVEAFILAGDTKKGLGDKDGAKMFYSMAKITIEKIFDSKEVRKKFGKEIEKKLKS
jgi:tetratricopeptide (TPR) repeat protein